mmetsp:Transcript_64419/g.178507  ORF Transcript_64419/g.178507 Transcript_64419/m.178507 type:complete len:258 (+) Transcript_64419:905-1678(+)
MNNLFHVVDQIIRRKDIPNVLIVLVRGFPHLVHGLEMELYFHYVLPVRLSRATWQIDQDKQRDVAMAHAGRCSKTVFDLQYVIIAKLLFERANALQYVRYCVQHEAHPGIIAQPPVSVLARPRVLEIGFLTCAFLAFDPRARDLALREGRLHVCQNVHNVPVLVLLDPVSPERLLHHLHTLRTIRQHPLQRLRPGLKLVLGLNSGLFLFFQVLQLHVLHTQQHNAGIKVITGRLVPRIHVHIPRLAHHAVDRFQLLL